MTIRTLIFDFGNVLGFFDHGLVSKRLVEYSSLNAEEIHAALFGGTLEHDYDRGQISNADFIATVRDICRLDCPDDAIVKAWSDIFWPNEEMLALLPRLKPRFRLLVGSNTNELHAAHFCRQFADAFRHFDHLVFSHAIRTRKPEAAFFQHCVRLAGCSAAECLFIDDLPANVAGAEACGLQGILFRGVEDLRGCLAGLGVVTTTD